MLGKKLRTNWKNYDNQGKMGMLYFFLNSMENKSDVLTRKTLRLPRSGDYDHRQQFLK